MAVSGLRAQIQGQFCPGQENQPYIQRAVGRASRWPYIVLPTIYGLFRNKTEVAVKTQKYLRRSGDGCAKVHVTSSTSSMFWSMDERSKRVRPIDLHLEADLPDGACEWKKTITQPVAPLDNGQYYRGYAALVDFVACDKQEGIVYRQSERGGDCPLYGRSYHLFCFVQCTVSTA